MALYEVRVNLDGPLAGLQRSLQRTIDLVAFGLDQAHDATDPGPSLNGRLDLPGAVMQIVPAKDVAWDFDGVRSNFEAWVLQNGLRDCTEALAPLLEEVRQIGVLATSGGTMAGDWWNEHIVDGAARFDKRNMPDKLGHLNALLGPSVMPELLDKIVTINAARNCLVHRYGIVGERDDPNKIGGLRVEWIKMEMVVKRKRSRNEEVITALPAKVNKGDTVSGRAVPASTFFALGEKVMFTAQEFSEICFTFLKFGQELRNNLVNHMRTQGFSITIISQTAPATSEPDGGSDEDADGVAAAVRNRTDSLDGEAAVPRCSSPAQPLVDTADDFFDGSLHY